MGYITTIWKKRRLKKKLWGLYLNFRSDLAKLEVRNVIGILIQKSIGSTIGKKQRCEG